MFQTDSVSSKTAMTRLRGAQVLCTCGTAGCIYPEEFYNCMDIRIVPSGTTVAPSPPITVPSTPQPPTTGFCSGRRDGYYANPDSASGSSYISCAGGRTTIVNCPAGTVFSSSAGACQKSSSLGKCCCSCIKPNSRNCINVILVTISSPIFSNPWILHNYYLSFLQS